jgi:HTH-type transcriptional regulator, sugar sensing transcriptional regulator
MKVRQLLEDLGIKDKKADVYLACLELGSATATRIAKKAEIKRPYFYDLADDLVKKGLIIKTVKGKIMHFSPQDPEKLKNIQEERLKKINEMLPELKSIFNTSGAKPKIYFYEGKDGIKEINKDTLKFKGEIVGFSTEKYLNAEEKKLSREYAKERVKNNLKARVIGPVSSEFIDLKKRDQIELRTTKMLPKNLYESSVEIVIYGNRISIVNYKEIFGFIIESSDIANVLKMIFELIWKGGFVID